MARLFDDGSSEYLELASAVVATYPLTLACSFYVDDTTTATSFFGLADLSDASGMYYKLAFEPTETLRVVSYGITAYRYAAIAGLSGNTWHHACGTYANNTNRIAYLDGGNKTTNADDCGNVINLDRTSIACSHKNGAAYSFFSGAIAEAAIWDVVLSDSEVAVLGSGYSPLFVHPENLLAYWPLIRDEDQDRVGGYDLTAFNTPSIATHAPVIYPAAQFVGKSVGAAAARIPRNPAYIYQVPAIV